MKRADGMTLAEAIARFDITAPDGGPGGASKSIRAPPAAAATWCSPPSPRPSRNSTPTRPQAASAMWPTPTIPDGGLAVLTGNIARAGCIVKTAGVDPASFHFKGPARVFESQDATCEAILQGPHPGRRRGGHPLRRTARRTRHAGNALSRHPT